MRLWHFWVIMQWKSHTAQCYSLQPSAARSCSTLPGKRAPPETSPDLRRELTSWWWALNCGAPEGNNRETEGVIGVPIVFWYWPLCSLHWCGRLLDRSCGSLTILYKCFWELRRGSRLESCGVHCRRMGYHGHCYEPSNASTTKVRALSIH